MSKPREYRVRVHRGGPITEKTRAQMAAWDLTPRELPEKDWFVTVRASRDELVPERAHKAAWAQEKIECHGQAVRYYEQMGDGTEREVW